MPYFPEQSVQNSAFAGSKTQPVCQRQREKTLKLSQNQAICKDFGRGSLAAFVQCRNQNVKD